MVLPSPFSPAMGRSIIITIQEFSYSLYVPFIIIVDTLRQENSLPVHKHLKFSQVLGQTSLNSSNTIRPPENN